jgi:hypothetical protein
MKLQGSNGSVASVFSSEFGESISDDFRHVHTVLVLEFLGINEFLIGGWVVNELGELVF